MKKRILALALAGTTAFSVFGAAISANAAWSSTDTRYNVDAYVSYAPVAGTIAAKANKVTAGYTKYHFAGTGLDYNSREELNEALSNSWDIKENYSELTPIGAYSETYNAGTGNGIAYLTADQKTIVYRTTAKDGASQFSTDNVDNLKYLGIKYTEGTKTYTVEGVYNTSSAESGLKVFYRLSDVFAAVAQRDAKAIENATPIYIVVKAPDFSLDKIKENLNNVAYTNTDDFIARSGQVSITSVGSTTTNDASITVTADVANADWDTWNEWTFNSDMTGEATVEPYQVKTTGTSNSLSISKVPTPTIYAYDFMPYNATSSSAGTISAYWNGGKLADAAAALVPYADEDGQVTLKAETGRGNANGSVRYDVVSDWIDFLDNLAINADNKGYVESEASFISNYADMFYSDPVYDVWTGQQVGSVSVDLYNIKGLLSDIYELNNSAAYYKANTSELVYLMQQYNKYIGNYIDKADVSTSEWGEMMLSVLNAATEDNFKKSSDYKKYMNKVEDLQDAYEEATTVGMVKEAEEGMYSLLTSTPYTVSSSADASNLSATLGSLYFNAKYAPATYAVNPSTEGNAAYNNYNYYVAVVTTDANNNPYNFSTTLKAGYYSLYPMADYIDNDATTPNTNYNGNVASADFNGKYATEEYEWFWNVYQLAVKMSGTNKYQGAVDAINDALTEAVSNLSVTTTPSSTETAAVADTMAKYEGKVDTDYNEGYYAKYTQANDYATNVAEGKWQTRIATMITGVAGEALTYQGTQVTVTKNDMKTLETAIKNGQTALEAIKANADYNAAQVNALNKAIAAAQTIVDTYEGTYSTSSTYQSVNKVYTRLVGDKDQIVKSDLTAAIEAIDSAINYSEIVMGWSQNDAGKWMYGTEEGYLSNGWNKIGKTWFYFNADGTAKQSEWLNDNGTWYWFNSNCGAATGWAKVDGEWYFFKGNNAMKTGWEKVDGNWYYMASSGKMVTGWCEVNGKWYYFSKESNSLGQMLYSTTVDGYKLGADGAWIK